MKFYADQHDNLQKIPNIRTGIGQVHFETRNQMWNIIIKMPIHYSQ